MDSLLEWRVWIGQDMDEMSVSQLSIAFAEGGSQLYRDKSIKVLEGDPSDHSF